MPFVLQDDDVIISKVNLLRGGNDQRRQSVIDTLPYFLGLVDESTVALESQLRRLRAALTSIQRRNAQLNRDRNEESSRALALVREAAAVGLAAAPTEATTVDEAFAILRDVAAWEGGDVQEVDESQLQALNARERELLNVLRRLRGQASAANELMRAASSFSDTASSQLRRLQVVDLLPSEPASDHCPLCSQNLESATPSTIVVRQALDQIASDLRSVETERPRLGQYVSRRLDEANDVQQQLNGVRREIRALVQQSEAVQRSIQVDNQRYHTVGRASLYLESFDPDSAQAGPDNTDALQAEIASIERQISRDAQEEANADVRLSLSNAATSILRALPFEDRYREFSVDFNPRDLSVGVITPQRRITMRGVGSDENYLSLHIAFLLAFHRHFASNQRPVPGLVVFDQLSRPFFPAEVNQDQLIMARIDERRELHQFFDVLFNEVERNEGLQVLVLEHAFFQEDNRFVEATRYMWTDSGLIPTGWPQVDHGTATNDSVQASLEFD